MFRKLIVFALIICIAMPTLAQVEYHVDVVDTFKDADTGFRGIREEYKTTADYMFLTNQEDDFCTGPLQFSDGQEYDIQLCIFEDPVTHELFLYAYGACCYPDFILLYQGEILGRLTNGRGISHPPSGHYEVQITHDYWSGNENLVVSSNVTFTLYPDSVAGEVVFRKQEENVEDTYSLDNITGDRRTIAAHLHRVQKEEYCAAELTPTQDRPISSLESTVTFCVTDCEISVCVFEDVETGEPFLYTTGATMADFMVFHESEFLGFPRNRGIPTLKAGEYDVLIVSRFRDFSGGSPIYRFGSVSFTIPDPSGLSVDD